MSAVRRIRPSVATPISIQAPVGGWNARDSLDEMDPTDAIILDNWFPGFGTCSIRGGSASYATGLGARVGFLAEFNTGGFRKFIAGGNGTIWDISAAGAAASLATGFGADTWETAQFDDSGGGARMGLVNGISAPQIYNGSTIAAMTISGTGLTPANLNGIHIYKNRSYFWDDRTQDFWYSATNALGGTLTKFPLGRVQGTGGNLMAMATWSNDSGNGIADYAVFVLNSGDIIVYAGDDPSSATAWTLVGRYSGGAPISKRGIKKIGADLLLVTKAGYTSLTAIIEKGRVDEEKTSLSSKIRGAAIDAAVLYSGNSGYELFNYPLRNWLLVNIPVGTTNSHQHVMNTETRAWCRFKGMNSTCFGLYRDTLYFGTSTGVVMQADTGHSDGGNAIVCDGQTAWNYLGTRARTKRVAGVRSILRGTGNLTYQIGAGCDFKNINLQPQQSLGFPGGSSWDVYDWDTADWADETITTWSWSSMNDSGYNMSQRLFLSSASVGCEWLSTTYLIERGGSNI